MLLLDFGVASCEFDHESANQFEDMFRTTSNSSKTYELCLGSNLKFAESTATVLQTMSGPNSGVAKIALSLPDETQSSNLAPDIARATTDALEVNTSVRIF